MKPLPPKAPVSLPVMHRAQGVLTLAPLARAVRRLGRRP